MSKKKRAIKEVQRQLLLDNAQPDVVIPLPTIRRADPVERFGPVVTTVYPDGSQYTHVDDHSPLPYVRDSETSREAAEQAKPRANYGEQAVLKCIRVYGPISDQDIASITGIDGNTVRPRRRSLEQQNLIYLVDTEARTAAGRRAQRWAILPPE